MPRSIMTLSIMTLSILWFSIMIVKCSTQHNDIHHYGRALLCWVSFMLSFTYKPCIIMLNVVMQSVVAPLESDRKVYICLIQINLRFCSSELIHLSSKTPQVCLWKKKYFVTPPPSVREREATSWEISAWVFTCP